MAVEDGTDNKLELTKFAHYLQAIGHGSLEVKFDLPERRALERAVAKLGPAVEILLNATGGRDDAALALWDALGAAYVIGSFGTLSDNSKAFIEQKKGEEMRNGKAVKAKENPANLIIQQTVERLRRPGDEDRPWLMARGMLDDVNRALVKSGLEPLRRLDRIARYLKGLQSPPRS